MCQDVGSGRGTDRWYQSAAVCGALETTYYKFLPNNFLVIDCIQLSSTWVLAGLAYTQSDSVFSIQYFISQSDSDPRQPNVGVMSDPSQGVLGCFTPGLGM